MDQPDDDVRYAEIQDGDVDAALIASAKLGTTPSQIVEWLALTRAVRKTILRMVKRAEYWNIARYVPGFSATQFRQDLIAMHALDDEDFSYEQLHCWLHVDRSAFVHDVLVLTNGMNRTTYQFTMPEGTSWKFPDAKYQPSSRQEQKKTHVLSRITRR